MRYLWIISAQAAGEFRTLDGTLTADPGTTRADVYKWARTQMHEKFGHGRFVIVFFSLDPNSLDGSPS